MSLLRDTIKIAVGLVPGRWLPGGTPDPLMQKHGLIGQPVSRIDGPLKVQGKARFAAEVPLEGLVYAALVHSTIARGRIATIDTAGAKAADGVVLVMTHLNAPRMKSPPLMMTTAKAGANSNLPVMQDAQIHWNGQAIALVLASSQEQADFAAALVRVTYIADKAVTDFNEAKTKTRTPASILGEAARIAKGDAEAALQSSPFKVDLTYRTPRHNHNAIELHAATVAWEGDNLTVHDATQMMNLTASTLAEIFGLREDQVRVLSPYVGGGFGGKGLWDHQILAAAASKLAARPVRIVLTREGVVRTIGGRTTTEQRVALGAKADGTLASQFAFLHSSTAASTGRH
jgi:xanthine dehydrogenase YagR molybdenum-binding subunit